jgi:hypothetical protein
MQKNLLNFIIAVAVLGIIVGIARDYVFSDHSSKEVQTIVPTTVAATPTPDPNPKTVCNTSFFSMKKGTQWKYQLTTTSPTVIHTLFTNEVIATNESSITLKTTIDGEKNSTQTILQCRKKGIYGIPVPLFSSQQFSKILALGTFSSMIKFDSSILFIPTDRTFVRGGSWDSMLNITLPFNTSEISIKLENKVESEKEEYLFSQGTMKTYLVSTHADMSSLKQFIGSPQSGNTRKVYVSKYAEKIGLISMDLYFDLKSPDISNGTLKLLQFTP